MSDQPNRPAPDEGTPPPAQPPGEGDAAQASPPASTPPINRAGAFRPPTPPTGNPPSAAPSDRPAPLPGQRPQGGSFFSSGTGTPTPRPGGLFGRGGGSPTPPSGGASTPPSAGDDRPGTSAPAGGRPSGPLPGRLPGGSPFTRAESSPSTGGAAGSSPSPFGRPAPTSSSSPFGASRPPSPFQPGGGGSTAPQQPPPTNRPFPPPRPPFGINTSSETRENTPPRPFGLNLFGTSPSQGTRVTQKSPPTEDRETAALMRDQLAKTLREGERHSPAVLRQAITGLGRVGEPTHADLIHTYTHTRWEQRLRLAAVHALGGIGGEKATDLLIGLLNDSDLVIQWAAQEMLDKLLAGPAPAEG